MARRMDLGIYLQGPIYGLKTIHVRIIPVWEKVWSEEEF